MVANRKTTGAAAAKAGPIPKIKDMLLSAISENANGRYGCSFTLIKKYLAEEYRQDSLSLIKRTMKSAISKGEIVPVKTGSVGLSGSFKLPPAGRVHAVKKSEPKRETKMKEKEAKKPKVKVVAAKKGPRASADPNKAPKKVAKAPAKKYVAPKKITPKPKVEEADEDEENSTKSETEEEQDVPAVPSPVALPSMAKRAPKMQDKENSTGSEEEEEEVPALQSPAPEPSKAKRAPKKKVLKEANTVDYDSGETEVKKQHKGAAKKPSESKLAPQSPLKRAKAAKSGTHADKPEAHASEQSDQESATDEGIKGLNYIKKRRNAVNY